LKTSLHPDYVGEMKTSITAFESAIMSTQSNDTRGFAAGHCALGFETIRTVSGVVVNYSGLNDYELIIRWDGLAALVYSAMAWVVIGGTNGRYCHVRKIEFIRSRLYDQHIAEPA